MSPATGLWRRTPPAIFPPAFGFLGLGLAWRGAETVYRLPVALGELLLGAGALLFVFMLLAWMAKPLRRPGVIVEDLRVLPGRAGLSAMTMSVMLVGAALVPYAPGLAVWVTGAGLAAHTLVAALIVHGLVTGPAEARGVTPVWHLSFVGFIVAPLSLVPLGYDWAGTVSLLVTVPVACAIWAISLWQLFTRIPPAPLRPLLAIHLAPASLFCTVASLVGMPRLAAVFAVLAVVILVALLVAARWLTSAGFSPLWGAFTFPLAACAGALITLAEGGATGAAGVAGGVVLVAATLAIPPILTRVLQAWARGGLAARTNAAEA